MAMEQAIEYALSEEEPSAPTPSQQPSSGFVLEHTAGLTSREIEVLGPAAARFALEHGLA